MQIYIAQPLQPSSHEARCSMSSGIQPESIAARLSLSLSVISTRSSWQIALNTIILTQNSLNSTSYSPYRTWTVFSATSCIKCPNFMRIRQISGTTLCREWLHFCVGQNKHPAPWTNRVIFRPGAYSKFDAALGVLFWLYSAVVYIGLYRVYITISDTFHRRYVPLPH